MLFSYMLHFVAVITSVSVLATPLPYGAMLPDEGKLFDFSGGERILSDVGKDLARGNWRRTAHPDKVWIISNQTCTQLTYCSLNMSNGWISLFPNLYM